jgi:hypothetical protein
VPSNRLLRIDVLSEDYRSPDVAWTDAESVADVIEVRISNGLLVNSVRQNVENGNRNTSQNTKRFALVATRRSKWFCVSSKTRKRTRQETNPTQEMDANSMSPRKIVMTGALYGEDQQPGPMFVIQEFPSQGKYHVLITSHLTGEQLAEHGEFESVGEAAELIFTCRDW